MSQARNTTDVTIQKLVLAGLFLGLVVALVQFGAAVADLVAKLKALEERVPVIVISVGASQSPPEPSLEPSPKAALLAPASQIPGPTASAPPTSKPAAHQAAGTSVVQPAPPMRAQLKSGESRSLPANTVISGDVFVDGRWTADHLSQTGTVTILTDRATVRAPYGASVVVGSSSSDLAQWIERVVREVKAWGCAGGDGCRKVGVAYAP